MYVALHLAPLLDMFPWAISERYIGSNYHPVIHLCLWETCYHNLFNLWLLTKLIIHFIMGRGNCVSIKSNLNAIYAIRPMPKCHTRSGVLSVYKSHVPLTAQLIICMQTYKGFWASMCICQLANYYGSLYL